MATQHPEALLRERSKAWIGLGLGAALLASACGGHSKSAGRPGSSGTATTPIVHVVSVTPRHLSGVQPIVVSFAHALTAATPLPTLDPALPGRWARTGNTAVFTPAQAYPPDAKVKVNLVRHTGSGIRTIATRSSGNGSLKFAEQILARLHYLPLSTTAAAPASPQAEAAAVYTPPPGHFTWRYADVPSTLKKLWSANQSNSVLRGAVIAFQHQHHLALDGAVGPKTWTALIKADLAGSMDPDKYSYVLANLYLPQRLSVWVDGHTALTSAVNGGVAGAPTPLGTYPVYERFTSTTMQGTNPDGSHYKDPGVPWVNYFSGGSAVHGFPRASYGFPQSVGCLELPIGTAKTVYGMINYGTLVTVEGPYVPATTATPGAPSSPKPTGSASPKHTSKPTSSPTKQATSKPTASSSSTHKPRH
jgi:lipoprotein-anchoring transpeptidase ErfK/SrfK